LRAKPDHVFALGILIGDLLLPLTHRRLHPQA
jgi:hypothetical protein